MFRFLAFSLVVVSCAETSLAQRIDKIHFSLIGNVALPSEKLKEAVDNSIGGLGVGLGASLLINPMPKSKNSPFMLGADFNYLTFGRDKIESTADTPPYKTSFNFYSACGVIRFLPMPDKTGFVPYMDGILGAKIINARTKIDKDFFNTINQDEDEVINNATDTGLGYALGIGFFNKKYSDGEDGATISTPSFTLRVLYHWGATASYVKRGSVVVENGNVLFEKGESDLNMVMVQIGIFIF